ncbi:MAG: Uridylate kinase [Candidatus Diapherotrites archaeon ADurb.Bin253]|jgi:uridylate kinase|nr:MAG: Uridylate kinase [Candidatus Diapherotrites archaeon ADurb.Bin253]HNZ52402.1 UMP kinase [Candidatus Pacearchaeota archaeon]HOC97035.1 UMP kinase [Candidatus Pacearchaeota archaeon]HOF44361.1 UMP kinase [Candidatus Pacearchaeota archaeon]HOH04437.1 UMP kinase [Candidatus Pacearchaeota archaeon]
MEKKVIVLSLGGSLIIPDEINTKYLKSFKKTILKNTSNYKFIVVCGGGNIARKYISALKKVGMNTLFQSYAGISATRTNARFMSYFFNQDQKRGIPKKIREVKKYIKKYDIVFCGALEYRPNQTSDSTASEIAKKFKCEFINLTDVNGLYDKNPKEFKNAKLIHEISWEEFKKIVDKIKFRPGQHFVLDQTASKTIKTNKINTYILGKDMRQLDNLLNGKKFIGTKISG